MVVATMLAQWSGTGPVETDRRDTRLKVWNATCLRSRIGKHGLCELRGVFDVDGVEDLKWRWNWAEGSWVR